MAYQRGPTLLFWFCPVLCLSAGALVCLILFGASFVGVPC
jgi:hypothetical protein